MLKELVKIANKLDAIGLTKEADYIDSIIRNASWTKDEMEMMKDLSESLEMSPAPKQTKEERIKSLINHFISNEESWKNMKSYFDFMIDSRGIPPVWAIDEIKEEYKGLIGADFAYIKEKVLEALEKKR